MEIKISDIFAIFSILFLLVALSGCVGKEKPTQGPPETTSKPTETYSAPTWKVGQWVQYNVKDREGKESTMKYSIVGSEVIEGKTYFWYEMKVETAQGKSILKYLFSPDLSEIKRVVVKSGDQPAVEMPASFFGQYKKSAQTAPSQSTVETGKVGTEVINVPAGTFTCIHYRTTTDSTTFDSWISGKVPIIAMVKSAGSDGFTMGLIEYGTTGAQTEITETPQQMPIPTQ
ncbi:MAG: hypothetical protein HY929_00725 [Euryarchaeota archaeon]|nr:hypothetical protein [Euryarchaeota archaeon]